MLMPDLLILQIYIEVYYEKCAKVYSYRICIMFLPCITY